MTRACIDLPYLEETVFHVERISDFITPNTPLCYFHITRTILGFFYFISIIIVLVLLPQIIQGKEILPLIVITFPFICTFALHLFLSMAYFCAFIFSEASYKSIVALIHSSYILPAISLVPFLITWLNGFLSFKLLSISLTISFFLQAILQVISRPSHRFGIILELLVFPSTFILIFLKLNNSKISKFICFLPIDLFFIFYFLVLSGLKFSKTRLISTKFLHDPEISAEFQASTDFESYWNARLWHDSTIEKPGSDDSDSSDNISEITDHNSRKVERLVEEYRFPKKAAFQLYKIDHFVQKPYCICSLSPMIFLTVALIMGNFWSFNITFSGLIWLILSAGLFAAIAFVLNCRNHAINFCIITNLEKEWINILWDHPSLGMF